MELYYTMLVLIIIYIILVQIASTIWIATSNLDTEPQHRIEGDSTSQSRKNLTSPISNDVETNDVVHRSSSNKNLLEVGNLNVQQVKKQDIQKQFKENLGQQKTLVTVDIEVPQTQEQNIAAEPIEEDNEKQSEQLQEKPEQQESQVNEETVISEAQEQNIAAEPIEQDSKDSQLLVAQQDNQLLEEDKEDSLRQSEEEEESESGACQTPEEIIDNTINEGQETHEQSMPRQTAKLTSSPEEGKLSLLKANNEENINKLLKDEVPTIPTYDLENNEFTNKAKQTGEETNKMEEPNKDTVKQSEDEDSSESKACQESEYSIDTTNGGQETPENRMPERSIDTFEQNITEELIESGGDFHDSQHGRQLAMEIEEPRVPKKSKKNKKKKEKY